MIELLELLLTTLGSVFRSRKRLILENLLLRQQLKSPSGANADPAFAPETSSSGCSSATSSGTGDAISSWSGPRLCCAGIARAGAGSGTGGRIIRSGGHD